MIISVSIIIGWIRRGYVLRRIVSFPSIITIVWWVRMWGPRARRHHMCWRRWGGIDMSLCRCYRNLPGGRTRSRPLYRSVHMKMVWLHGFNRGYRSLQSLRMDGLDWPSRGGFLRAPWGATRLMETVTYRINKDRKVTKSGLPFIACDFTSSPVDMEGLQLICFDAFVNPDGVENNFCLLACVQPKKILTRWLMRIHW